MKIKCPNCKNKKHYFSGISVFSVHERLYLQCGKCREYFSHIQPTEEKKPTDWSELWFGLIMIALIFILFSPLFFIKQ